MKEKIKVGGKEYYSASFYFDLFKRGLFIAGALGAMGWGLSKLESIADGASQDNTFQSSYSNSIKTDYSINYNP